MNNSKILKSEMFWLCNPNPLVSVWMKHDWLKMDLEDFVATYLKDALTTSNKKRKKAIFSVLVPIWDEMPTSQKYETLTVFVKGMHYADAFHEILKAYEIMKCKFLENVLQGVYRAATRRNFKTNYFKCLGLSESLPKSE